MKKHAITTENIIINDSKQTITYINPSARLTRLERSAIAAAEADGYKPRKQRKSNKNAAHKKEYYVRLLGEWSEENNGDLNPLMTFVALAETEHFSHAVKWFNNWAKEQKGKKNAMLVAYLESCEDVKSSKKSTAEEFTAKAMGMFAAAAKAGNAPALMPAA